ncbi:helix-turn-helix domain-containing protein [Herbaspirillum huttiense]|jgi:predicted XRE-type DNA-binding protein|uniref:Helix-turn-helix transcriptional regulator n=4 Tax=Herbaspirillum TaxID=963 RepID=A0AAJ2LRM6_9BURK|nr:MULTISPECIES: helix-turn-helix transcriptional regulator [Herbaspirillum]MBW9333615.1 XRE family transcriptional regulator [Herbaspirillum sp. RU 5E]MBN9354890.1 XRE family transcriptional regulator [Herbaspirillum huttiense]MCO4858624.1 helix-turn-helix domain-containing protein [Herbaspirillum sp. WGmk3]MCP3654520.1 XRE family transcriptional regulator [Herbaspirillum sp.]MCP3948604.1 XRE family transcriptional regulator [Herbaspirillum sp.]
MQTTDPRWNDDSIVSGSGNVFIDLGFEPAEAEVMLMRVKVLAQTSQRLKEKGWTQAKAAEELGITQPRVSRLLKGKVEDFSLDMLVTLAGKLGLKPQISFAG